MEVFNTVSHGLWAILCFPLFYYIWKKYRNEPYKLITMEIFSLSIFSCYTLSTAHHLSPHDQRLLLLDVGGIYGLILGTYTPIIFLVLGKFWRKFILTIVLGLCIIGAVLNLLYGISSIWISNIIYVTAGWIVILTYKELIKILPLSTVLLLFLGGTLYTVGAILNISSHMAWRHEIFHVLVMSGTLTHLLFLLKVSDAVATEPPALSAGKIYVEDN